MAVMYQFTCDGCGTNDPPNAGRLPEGWSSVLLSCVTYHFCRGCATGLVGRFARRLKEELR